MRERLARELGENLARTMTTMWGGSETDLTSAVQVERARERAARDAERKRAEAARLAEKLEQAREQARALCSLPFFLVLSGPFGPLSLSSMFRRQRVLPPLLPPFL